MVVVDSSAVLVALVASGDGGRLVERLSPVRELHTAELLDVEFLICLRRLLAIGALTPERAQLAREDLVALRLRRHAQAPLADRVWELRDRLSPAEGVYVALAEVLELPLVTCDPALANASGALVDVELVA